MNGTTNTFATTTLSLGIGVGGAALAWLLHFPAPALTGPALLVSLACVAGLRLSVPKLLRDACFVIIGLSMGTGVTPQVYETARQWPLSFLFLGIGIVIIFLCCRLVLQRLWNQDRSTAILSSMPGHLSYVLGLSTTTRGDLPTISVIQSTRVLSLTLLVPFAVSLMGYDTSKIGLPGAQMTPGPLALSIGLALLLGLVLNRLRVPAALLIGGMVFSTVTHLSGLVVGHVPLYASIPAFVAMGTLIGTRFTGVAFQTLRRAFGAGMAVTVIALVITICFALLLVQFVDLPLPQVLIAFAPGGVESMAAMAVIMNADPTFVAAHHVWRIVILTFLAPMMLGRSPD